MSTEKIDRMDERARIADLDVLRKPLLEARDAAWLPYDAADPGSDAEAAAEAAYDAAEAVLTAHDEDSGYNEVLDYDENGMARVCVLTGLVLLEGDEIVEDSEGRQALAAAIEGWPAFSDDGAANDDEVAA